MTEHDPDAPYGRMPNGHPRSPGLRDPVLLAKAQAARKENLADRRRRAERTRAEVNVGFLEAVKELWREQGQDILQRAARDHPEKVMKVLADLMPKQMEIKGSAVQDLDDDRISELIEAITDRIGRGAGAALEAAASRAGAETIDAEVVEVQAVPKAT